MTIESIPAATPFMDSMSTELSTSSRGKVVSRSIDVLLSSLAIVFFLPLMLLLAVLIRLQDGGPAIYRQPRIGFGGRVFNCLKLRSMVADSDAKLRAILANDPLARREWELDHKLRKDPRITKLGAFLRKSSLDELPQLFNVLCGDMSLVGPRPIVAGEISRYRHWFSFYCQVRPGITGLWQVRGRNDVSYTRRVAMDVAYVKNRSWRLDLFLIIQTIPAVFLTRGSY